MPSLTGKSAISRLSRSRRRNKEADFEVFFGEDLRCEPLAVGSHGRGAGVAWIDYPIDMGTLRWFNLSESSGWWFTKMYTNASVLKKVVKYHVNSRGSDSMGGKIIATRPFQHVIEQAKKTKAPWFGLMSNIQDVMDVFHVLKQNELPWCPTLIRNEVPSSEYERHDDKVNRIGAVAAQTVFIGHVLKLAGLLSLIGFLIYIFVMMIIDTSRDIISKDTALLGLVIYLASSLVFFAAGYIYIHCRTKLALGRMRAMCQELNREAIGTEKGTIKRYDILVSTETFTYTWIRNPITEVVSLYVNTHKCLSWRDTLLRRAACNYFLRYSEYPIEYYQYFQSKNIQSENVQSIGNLGKSFTSVSSESHGTDRPNLEREGVVCNPYCESYTTVHALTRMPYKTYVMDEASNIGSAEYVPHGFLC